MIPLLKFENYASRKIFKLQGELFAWGNVGEGMRDMGTESKQLVWSIESQERKTNKQTKIEHSALWFHPSR